VDANRSVNISTKGDSGALLSLTLDTASYNGLSDTSGSDSGTNNTDTIQIELEKINDDATTTFDNALTIENNGNNPVDLSIDDTSPNGVAFSLDSTSVQANAGDDTDQTTADITVDTTQSVSDGEVTITATDNS